MEGFKLDRTKWVKTRLSDLADEMSEREDNPGESNYERFVGLEHFVSGDLKIKKWTSTEGLTSAAKVFKAGDVLFARRNAYLRRASLVDFNGLCSGDAFVLRENHKKIVPGFLTFILNSDKLWDFANANAAGTMSKRVKWRDLGTYEVLLPPLDQQAKLAELLWAGDRIESTWGRLLMNLQKLYAVLHKKYFENAPYITIEHVADKVGSGKTPLGGEKNYRKEGIPFIRSQNVGVRKMDFSDVAYIAIETHHAMKSTIVRNGDVLLNITGASIGRCAVYDKSNGFAEANVNQHVCIIRSASYSPLILCEYLNSKYGQEQINLLQTGGNREGLNFQNVRRIKIPNISDEIQLKLIRQVECLQETINKCETHLQIMRSLRSILNNSVFHEI